MSGHLLPILPLASHRGLFFASHCILSKRKVYLGNHTVLRRLQAVSPPRVGEQRYRKKRITGWLSFYFPMVNVLYSIHVYRMYLPCDVN